MEIEELDLGPLGPEDVLVRVAACGVCHSDLHAYLGQLARPLPLVMGHEAAGTVVETGADVERVAPGDHVVLSFLSFCGRCLDCTTGRTYRCTAKRSAAGLPWDGRPRLRRNGAPVYQLTDVAAFAEHAIVHESGAIPVPEEAPLDRVCLIGCAVTTGVGAALNTARVRPGSAALVIGCGGIGLNAIQGARLAGAERILAADLRPQKLDLATTFGATHRIDAREGDTAAQALKLTGGRGVDYAFEAVGTPATIEAAFDALAPGGKAVVMGLVTDRTQRLAIAPAQLMPERALMGSPAGSTQPLRDIPYYVSLYLGGRLRLDELVSATAPLERIEEAFRDLERGDVVRTVITLA